MPNKPRMTLTYYVSAIVGCVLLGVGLLGMAWLFFGGRFGSFGIGASPPWLQPNGTSVSANSEEQQLPVLLAHGITLAHPADVATISQQEALLLANQREPDSLNAKKITARYEIVTANSNPANLKDKAAWVVWYQNIGDMHDLYVVLDANSGTELFALRT